MDPVTIISAIGAAAKTMESIKSLFGKKPKPSDPVKELKPYLLEILTKMEVIRQLNIQILTMVSQLPGVIREIVRGELDLNNLKTAYERLETLRVLFDAMGEEAQFDVVTSSGFISICNDLSTIFEYENKVGNLGPMLANIEFADVATKRQGSTRIFFKSILGKRIRNLEEAQKVLVAKFQVEVESLNTVLNSQYVSGSNADSVKSTFELIFFAAPDRERDEIYYTTEIKVIDNGMACCRTRVEHIQIPHVRKVPDTSFTTLRDEAIATLEEKKKIINVLESGIVALSDDISLLTWYSDDVLSGEDKALQFPSFLFIPDKVEKAVTKDAPLLPRANKCYGE